MKVSLLILCCLHRDYFLSVWNQLYDLGNINKIIVINCTVGHSRKMYTSLIF